jgi:hypothetical protein
MYTQICWFSNVYKTLCVVEGRDGMDLGKWDIEHSALEARN